MRSRTLLTQVLFVNTVLVALTAFVAAVVAREHPPVEPPGPVGPVLLCTRASIVRTGSRLLVGSSSHALLRAAAARS